MTFYAIIAALIIMLASLSGIAFATKRLGSWMEKNLAFLVTFSIGVFAVITWGLFDEAFSEGAGLTIAIAAFGGMLSMKLSEFLIPGAHHHHDADVEHGHSRVDARNILFGDAVHNIADGFLLVPAFLASPYLGIATAFGIFVHELVQGISQFFVLREAGYSTSQALARNFGVSGTILVGVALSVAFAEAHALEAPFIGFAAGGFLYVVLADLLPHTASSIKRRGGGDKHIQAIILGVLIMLGVNTLMPHAHEEEESGRENESALHE